jgi:hypothetical protein
VNIKKLRPSPAMIVATVALFVALGGAAYAGFSLPNNSVRSNHIVNGQVKTADLAVGAVNRARIKNNAVNSIKVADGGLEVADLSAAAQAALKGNAGPAGPAGTPATTLWAVVNANGTLARGAAGVTSTYSGASFYSVDFPRNVTGCTYVATIGGTSNAYGGTGEISVYSQNLDPNGVTVVTHNSTGAFADRPFHLAVFC